MLIIYSGGMHHIQAPGEKWPKLFQTIHARLESADITDYKQSISLKTPSGLSKKIVKQEASPSANREEENLQALHHEYFKTEVIKDLTQRRSQNLSQMEGLV